MSSSIAPHLTGPNAQAIAGHAVGAQVSAMVADPAVYALLTPETLLTYCESKIRGIDEQVQRAFASQKSRGHMQEALSELAEALDPNGFDGDKVMPSGKTKREEVLDKYDAAIAAVGPNTDVGKQLAANRDAFDKDASGKKQEGDTAYVSRDDMKSYADPVQQMQADFNRQGELEMIQLQSLMSQRQQALQMCTNMIAGLGQSSQQIAANIGK